MRLEALASGQVWLFGMLFLFQFTTGFTKHAFTGDRINFWVAVVVWLLIGTASFRITERCSAGLGWGKLSAVGLAALLTLIGPFWSIIGRGAEWAVFGYLICYVTIVGLLLSKVKAELKRAGYVAPKGNMNKQQAALSSFISRRRDQDAHPPVPENLFSGEGPEARG